MLMMARLSLVISAQLEGVSSQPFSFVLGQLLGRAALAQTP